MGKSGVAAVTALILFAAGLSGSADTLEKDTSWNKLTSDGESLVFGRFIGKFESPEFRSRRVRMRNENTGKDEFLAIDDGLGYIAERVEPGVYSVIGVEAVYYPPIKPFKPLKYRPIRQKYGVKPKTGDALQALIHVPVDRPVYIGTIRAVNEQDGIVYRGHQLRVFDDYETAFERLEGNFPRLAESFADHGVVPARHFMLKPTRQPDPLEAVVGMDDPVRQARDYIEDGKYQQAVNWLATFMPVSDDQRTEARLLIGEAYLADGKYPEAIEELGEVLLTEPEELRALRLLARAHAYNGDLEDAVNLYEALTVSVPEDAESHLHLGYLYALREDASRADEEFGSAFQTDFDYLLHDVGPFIVAMRAAFEEELGDYIPAQVVKYRVPPPKGMQSRRSSETGGIAVLIDHRGKVIAALMGPDHTGGRMPMMMLSLVRADYEPASLNGIPVPSILTLGLFGGSQGR